MRGVLVSVLVMTLLSGCVGYVYESFSSGELGPAFPMAQDDGALVMPPASAPPTTVVGVATNISGGEPAAFHPFDANILVNSRKKSLRLVVTGFSDVDFKLIEPTEEARVQLRWLLLAEDTNEIARFAEVAAPKTDRSHPDYGLVTLAQLTQCRGYSALKVNDVAQYQVRGVCIYDPHVMIPKNFKNIVFINDKLVFTPSA